MNPGCDHLIEGEVGQPRFTQLMDGVEIESVDSGCDHLIKGEVSQPGFAQFIDEASMYSVNFSLYHLIKGEVGQASFFQFLDVVDIHAMYLHLDDLFKGQRERLRGFFMNFFRIINVGLVDVGFFNVEFVELLNRFIALQRWLWCRCRVWVGCGRRVWVGRWRLVKLSLSVGKGFDVQRSKQLAGLLNCDCASSQHLKNLQTLFVHGTASCSFKNFSIICY